MKPLIGIVEWPYLGICAGMQIMKVHQIPYVQNEKNDSFIKHNTKEEYAHTINIVKDTLLSSIINKEQIEVNSRHNYHVPNSGIKKVSAYAEDGIIEALEDPSKLFHLGVQWHPELLPINDESSQALFGNFIEAAKTYKKTIKRELLIIVF